jgi:isoquinoline 1-oxidoreductase alpha subunit
LINGNPSKSCITPVNTVVGEVTTVEGLEINGKLMQCGAAGIDGFSIPIVPGMIMTAVALLKKDPGLTDDAIVKAMNGNICRCGTYPYIVKAIQLASKS